MSVSGNDSKDLLSLRYYWNKARMAHCQVKKSTLNMRSNEIKINSDSSELLKVHPFKQQFDTEL